MKRIVGLLLIVSFLGNCEKVLLDPQFESIKDEIYTDLEMWYLTKERDTSIYHFPELVIFDHALRSERITFFQKQLSVLQKIDSSDLSMDLWPDYFKAKTILEEQLNFYQNDLEKDPTVYSTLNFIKNLLVTSELAGVDHVLMLNRKLKSLPPNYEAAKSLLQNPDIPKINQAIQENSQAYFLIQKEMTKLLRNTPLSKTQRNDFEHHQKAALLAIKDFIAFLTSLKFEATNNEPSE